MDVNFYQFEVNGKTFDKPHEGQLKILESEARFKIVCCGRRFGKTIFSINTLLEYCLINPGHTYWYVAPTFRQAQTIAWRYLMTRIQMLPRSYRNKMKINSTLLTITFPNSSILELKGVERPENLLGTGLDGVVLDEYATEVYGSGPIWKEIIRPCLSDRNGWGIIISTPKGYNHFFELHDYAMKPENVEWEAWQMPSSLNPLMTEKELLSARQTVGEDLYSQEYLAEFKKRSGLVYKDFDREVHIVDFDPEFVTNKWALEIGVDFGANHPTAVVFVLFSPEDVAYIVDEHYETHLDSNKHIEAIKAKENFWLGYVRQNRPRVRWGDPAASQTILDWTKIGYYVTPAFKRSGSIEGGIALVAQRLRADIVTRKPKLYIDKRCSNTIREFENYAFIENSSIEDDEVMKLASKRKDTPRKVFDDAMDALRYVMLQHIPLGNLVVKKLNRDRERDPMTGI